MLRYRLLLGPVLIAVVVGVLWLDEAIDRTATPDVLSGLLGGRATLPPDDFDQADKNNDDQLDVRDVILIIGTPEP